MSWTATFRDARFDGKWNVAVNYTDGVVSTTKGYTLDTVNLDLLKTIARNEVAAMNAAAIEVVPLTAGASIDLTPPTPPTPPTPTAEEIAREAWFADFNSLQKLLRLANTGLISIADSRIITLQTSLRALWLPTYMDGV